MRTADWGRPPRVLVAASALVLGGCAVLAVLGAARTGVATDEPIHVMRLRNYLDTGWYALDWDFAGTHPGADDTNTFVYGPVAMLLLHAWSVLWGVEGWDEVAGSTQAYHVRHLGVVLVGMLGVAAVAGIGRALSGRWRWGLVAAACLVAVPMWTGHVMVNVKDVPVATGSTLVTLGLILFVTEASPGSGLRLCRAGCLLAGLVLTLGTRPGMGSGIVAALLVAVAGILLGSASRRDACTTLAELAGSAAAAAAALGAIYPTLFGSPLAALSRAAERSVSFRDGESADRLYVPRHLLTDTPTLLLAFLVTGAVVGAAVWWTHKRALPVQATRIALVGVQAFTLPLSAVVLGADLYHGLRQLLFFAPAAAVLTAYGMAWWRRRLEPRRVPVGLVAAAALLLPVVDQVTLQPYQTTYVNLATDLVVAPAKAGGNRPGGDFWRVSIPELIAGVPLDRQLLCKATVDQESNQAFSFTDASTAYSTRRSLDCRDEVNGPLASERLEVNRAPGDHTYDAVFLETVPANCTPRNEVTRRRHGFTVVLTVLARCTVDPPPLTATAVRADSPSLGTATADDLWRFAVNGWEQWPRRRALRAPVPMAELAFRPVAGCRRTGCRVVLWGSGPTDLVARIADERVRVSPAGPGRVGVAITAQQASNPAGVWLTLTRRSGGPLGVRLTALSLEVSARGATR